MRRVDLARPLMLRTAMDAMPRFCATFEPVPLAHHSKILINSISVVERVEARSMWSAYYGVGEDRLMVWVNYTDGSDCEYRTELRFFTLDECAEIITEVQASLANA